MRSSNRNKLVTIGRVAGTKGVGTRLRVLPLTYDPKRFLDLGHIFIDKDGDVQKKIISDASISGRHVLLEFEDFISRDDLEKYSGCEVQIEESECAELPDGIYYHFQILGLDVVTESGIFLGKVEGIIETGSNDVYSVVGDDKEILIPAIKDVIKDIDLGSGRITVSPMKGLLDEV